MEEVEEQKKRLAAKLSEVEQELESAQNKISQLEKVKHHLLAEHCIIKCNKCSKNITIHLQFSD